VVRGQEIVIEQQMSVIPLGKSITVRQGKHLAILAFGSMVDPCRTVAERLDATLINMRFVKPLDREAILAAAASHAKLVTVEENALAGGAGSGVNELLAAEGSMAEILNVGLGDCFLEHASREECLHLAGLDVDGIMARVVRFTGRVQQAPLLGTSIR
jgi:1-deoxy-D-xylulose-5-phosphate synthase